MLLFPSGNLSHTSILYYTILHAKVKYNFFKDSAMQGNIIDKVQRGRYSVDDSYIDNLRSYNHIATV
jgi:hypothetical protein